MHVCEYCSQENSTTGPCQRCGIEGNPSSTPWGIRERRDTKYWHKYNWDNRVRDGKNWRTMQPFNQQEQANIKNHLETMGKIRPMKISNATHKTVREPVATEAQGFKPTSTVLEGEETITPSPIPLPKDGELPLPLPPPEPITPEEAEEIEDGITEVLRAFVRVPPRTSISSIMVNEETALTTFNNINVLAQAAHFRRNKQKLFIVPRKVLTNEGTWSMVEENFRTARGITNLIPNTKDQTGGTCYAFATTDVIDWYTNSENAAMYTARLYPITTLQLGKDGSEGGNEKDAWLGLELNSGRIAETIVPGSNQDPGGQPVLDMSVEETQRLMTNSAQPYSIPSTPNHYNLWSHRVRDLESTWELMCSSVYHGIPMTLSYKVRKVWIPPMGPFAFTAKGEYDLHPETGKPTGHAVSVYGVAITDERKKPSDFPDTKNNPYKQKVKDGTKTYQFKEEFKKFLKELKKIDSSLNVRWTRTKDGFFHIGKIKNEKPEHGGRINELIRDYFNRFLPSTPPVSPTDESLDENNDKLDDTKPPKKIIVIEEDDTKPPKPPAPPSPAGEYEGKKRWILVHNSWGDKWRARGWAWVEWEDTFCDDCFHLTGKHEVTSTNNPAPLKNPSPQMEKASTPVQMRPRATTTYEPTGFMHTKPEMLVALDIDDTLLDTSQRMRSAKRMGLYDPKQVGKKQHPKGREAFREFFYSSDRFSLDVAMKGTADFARELVQKGYKVAYITGRPQYVYELTKQQLKHHGFPMVKDKYGADLLYCKPETAKDTSGWKKGILSSLQTAFDVRFFFDNNPKNLEAARQLGIPGLYLSIDQYTGITDLANRFKKAPTHIDNPGADISSYRVAAGCIVQRNSDKKVLLLRRSPKETSMHGLYELPGGKLEEGETPKQTAKVETKEEAGLDVKIVKEITPAHVDHDMQKCYHCFLARPKKGAKVVLSEEHDHYMWVTPQQALTMTEPLSHHAEHFFRLMTGMKVNSGHIDEEEEMYRDLFDDTPYANPINLLPIYNGEPKGMAKNLGIVSAEVEVGRNIFADIGEGIQDIYKGLIGGRQSMTEKRMTMAVAALQAELSERAKAKGGHAIANLQVDFGSWKKSAVAVVAFGDAITLRGKKATVRNNPNHKDGTKLYKDFNGKAPDVVQSTTITVPTTLVRVGEGGCWSVGYRSDKEGHGKNQKYIHEFGDFGRFPKKKPKKGNKKEPDLYAALDENGNVIDLRIIGGTFSLDVDPDSGINWLVG